MKIKDKIIQGDALNILKKISDDFIDLGITSPPYNKGEKNKGWLVKNVKYNTVSDNVLEDVYQEQQVHVLNEIFRVTKQGGSFFYNHKTRWVRGEMLHPIEWLRKTKWTIRQEIIWDRMIAANIRGWRFWQIDERVYWLYKPIDGNEIGKELKSKHALLTSIWRFPPERKNGHPAPFPLLLPTRIIYSILDGKKGVVLDPYVGSGTTCLAAKLLGSNYIGIDISKKYVEDAENRLKNYLNYKKIMDEEMFKHTVEKTFADRKNNNKNTGKYRNRTFSLQTKFLEPTLF